MIVPSSRPASALEKLTPVSELLSKGMPFDLTHRALKQFTDQCDRLLSSENLTATHPDLAVKVLAAQAVATAQLNLSQGVTLSERVAALVRAHPTPLSEAYSLTAWAFSHPAPEYAEERARAADRILAVSEAENERTLLTAGYHLLFVALLEQGQIRTLDARILDQRTGQAGLDSSSHNNPAHWFDCLRSILDGDTERAEQLAETLYSDSEGNDSTALALYTTQIGMIRWMQGRGESAEDGFLAARREYPEQLLWSASLAWLWFLQGRRTAAETLLNTLPDPEELPRDSYWLSTVTVLAEIATLAGDRDQRQKIYETLLPYARFLVPAGVGVAFWGTCARTLGLLAEKLGYLDEARAHLELALDLTMRIGALAWLTEAQIELAEFALRHDLEGIAPYELLAEARATGRARKFPQLEQRAMRPPQIRVLGRFEVISLCGSTAKWSSRKARELLKILVAARGATLSREVLMHELWPDENPSRLSNRFAVAVNVVRRSLDPDKITPTQHHLVTEGNSVRLELKNLDIDLEKFCELAENGDELSQEAARKLYLGDAFADDPYAEWAERVRDHAKYLYNSIT